MRIIIFSITILLSLVQSGCETTGGSGAKSWELGSPVDEEPAILTIEQGATFADVFRFLGEPKEKRTNPEDPGYEEWIYERRVVYGQSLKSGSTGDMRITAYQGQRSVETARIRFRDGLVEDIVIRRVREDMDFGRSPFQRD